jgi:hypothetical protein
MIDNGMSGLIGMSNNKYTSQDKLIDRANSNLKKIGYDKEGAERQVASWAVKVKQWMEQSGRM